MGRKQILPILISQASPDSFPPGEAKALRVAILQTTIYRSCVGTGKKSASGSFAPEAVCWF
ncbi:MAG: hypothetical protein MR763_12160 [Clostridiales bacterium]|nr:hypothetical protein [Clostridiales bacterium]